MLRTGRWVPLGGLALLLGLLAVGWLVAPRVSQAQDEALYFVTTGQRLDNSYGFLGHWRASNGPLTLGAPLTPPLLEHGLVVQYFELGRLELHPEYEGAVLRGHLGAEYAQALWREFAPPSATPSAGGEYFAATGYSIAEPFLGFWHAAGGLDVFGLPLSAPAWEYVGAQMAQVQYFERARLEYYPELGATALQMSALGRDLVLLRGLPTAPVDPAGALVVDNLGQQATAQTTAWLPLANPTATPLPPTATPVPTAAPAAPAAPVAAAAPAAPVAPAVPRGGKSIIVDLSDQWLYAYEGEQRVFDAPVSTGRDGFNTPVGRFAIYYKVRSQTMSGCSGGECWSVPNVPHAMYIVGDVAMHGTYWHNQFGSGVRRSHGCINLAVGSAAWLYTWAPLGTPVTVRW
ncbi:MAG: murein L,D-transpeptidase [Candidatus Viridilinea halotolerans]|uniref:Murein L,D-transpeptidase n=1 Tax=Candidatus Viridilinea halotolerans TaxID=2491704 RepID=A0A426TZU2_9CHLR|nr:MAG: murein L,D-transpeptidase [Candidatus Viridilinea halotolerans]